MKKNKLLNDIYHDLKGNVWEIYRKQDIGLKFKYGYWIAICWEQNRFVIKELKRMLYYEIENLKK